MLTELYTKAINRLVRLKSQKGQTLLEYGLILALVAIVVLAVLTVLGAQLKSFFSKLADALWPKAAG